MVRDKKKESLMFSTLNRFCGSREVFSSNNNIKTHLNSDLLFTGFFRNGRRATFFRFELCTQPKTNNADVLHHVKQ